MYCKKCGNEIIQGEKFCRSCGCRIELNTSYHRKTENKQSTQSFVPIVIFIVAFVAVAVAILVIVTNSKNSDVIDTADTTISSTISSQYNGSLSANPNSLYNSSYAIGSLITSTSKDFILPESSTKLISTSDLKNLSNWEITLAINEIYARHGRKFDSKELQDYFSNKSWYRPSVNPKDFTTAMLSEIEMKNLDILVKYQKNN